MAALISFFAGENYDLNGSGLAFFGDGGFGASVAVGSYQGRTFISDGNGVTQGAETDNIKWVNSASGIIGQTGSGIALTAIPNDKATLNIRFTNDSAIKTQNVEVRIYDRSNINNAASGVTTKVAELIHPTTTNLNNGSGDTAWLTPAGSSVVVDLAPSPGPSGLFAGDGSTSTYTNTQHDWYLAISASPDSIGSKTLYGLYISLEYL